MYEQCVEEWGELWENVIELNKFWLSYNININVLIFRTGFKWTLRLLIDCQCDGKIS